MAKQCLVNTMTMTTTIAMTTTMPITKSQLNMQKKLAYLKCNEHMKARTYNNQSRFYIGKFSIYLKKKNVFSMYVVHSHS